MIAIGTHIAARVLLHDMTFWHIIGWVESHRADGAYLVRITDDDGWGMRMSVRSDEVIAVGLAEIYK